MDYENEAYIITNWVRRQLCSEDALCPSYLRHGNEHGALFILLPDIGEAGEDEHPHDDHQHQQPQLLVAEMCNNIRRQFVIILY